MNETRTPVSGGNASEGKPDGVSGPPGGGNTGDVQGRSPGGESEGGSYPNPQSGKRSGDGGFMGHGGQTDIGYYGGGQAGEKGGDAPNAATGSDSSDGDERGEAPWPSGVREAHSAHAGGQTFDVVETNGVAAAEASGKLGTDAPYEREQESPGSG